LETGLETGGVFFREEASHADFEEKNSGYVHFLSSASPSLPSLSLVVVVVVVVVV